MVKNRWKNTRMVFLFKIMMKLLKHYEWKESQILNVTDNETVRARIDE